MVTKNGAVDLTASDPYRGLRWEVNATILDVATLSFNMMHVLSTFLIYDVNSFLLRWIWVITIWPVYKADTMCWLIYWFHLVYIWSLNSELIIHSMLSILPRQIQSISRFLPVNQTDTFCGLFYWVHLVQI